MLLTIGLVIEVLGILLMIVGLCTVFDAWFK